jgi:hypothetical protein
MKESIFAEFQYFIRRINGYRSGVKLGAGESIEDLEQRFRVQVERGLVIIEPHEQEIVMEILLSSLNESEKRLHIMELRRTGKTSYQFQKTNSKESCKGSSLTLEQKRERALDLMIAALNTAGVKAQKQPLAVKMLMAEYSLENFNFDSPDDLKLLFVNTVKISGHVKKANPAELALIFNDLMRASQIS